MEGTTIIAAADSAYKQEISLADSVLEIVPLRTKVLILGSAVKIQEEALPLETLETQSRV
jgi:hypothetical protein